jgi:hypothetical protein
MSPLFNAVFSTMGFYHRRDYLELHCFFIVFFPRYQVLGTNSFPMFSKPLKDRYFLLIEVAYVACAFIF